MAAPKGNKNSSQNNRLWAETIRRATLEFNGKRLRKIAEALLTKAEEGDISAIKEIGDRLDGKAIQAVDATVDATLTVEIVRYGTNPAT